MHPTLISLMNQYKLTTKDDSKIVADDLHNISYTQDLLQYLDMEVPKDIDLTSKDQRTELLLKWKERKGKDATYRRLLSALVEAKCLGEANNVCKLLQKSGPALKQQESGPALEQQTPWPQKIDPTSTHKLKRTLQSPSLTDEYHNVDSLRLDSDSDCPSPPRLEADLLIKRPRLMSDFPYNLSVVVEQPLKESLKAEYDTKEMKLEFSHILSESLKLFRYMTPHEIVNLLSCYDKSYLDVTKDYKNKDDLISALIGNISFLDYDLIEFLNIQLVSGHEINPLIFAYKNNFAHYLKKRVAVSSDKTTLTLDQEMQILPSDKKKIRQIKMIAQKILHFDITINSSLLPITPGRDAELELFKNLKRDIVPIHKSILSLHTNAGVTVLQETVVHVNNSSQSFHWEGYGLKLHIPPGSLPGNAKSCTITIKVSLSGQYLFPINTELVSPVFWMKCEPWIKFKFPLSLEIEHCAPIENSHRLFMTRALCSQQDLPYLFKVLHGGTFTKHSTYGSIALDQFSMGVVQERSNERRYWSNVFYMGPPNSRDIHFTVTWHNDAHITAIKEHYKSRKAIVGPEQALVFKENEVTLNVPRDGCVLHDEWKVLPTIPPKILKQEVDDHLPSENRTTVPHCELVAKWMKGDQQVKPLEHTIDILGTTDKEKYFTIIIDPGISETEDEGSGTTTTVSTKQLENRHLHTVCECLKDLPKDDVIKVGLSLGLYYPSLVKMEMLLQDMVHAWLLMNDNVMKQSGIPTTGSLIKALESLNLSGAIDKVKDNFIIT